MPYLEPQVILDAKKVDLLTYLREHEPDELIRCSGGYRTRTHDSLKISNGMWMWWSRGIGGRSALDYLIKVKGIDFVEAVKMITGNNQIAPVSAAIDPSHKQLQLPEKSATCDIVIGYLKDRGIDEEIIQDCIDAGLIYESASNHNVIFVGKDKENSPRYAAYRASSQERFMGDCSGSDKQYSFRLVNPDSRSVHVFESAIDALSYATLIKMNDGDYRNESLLSLAGVSLPGRSGEGKIPVSLQKMLDDHRSINRIYLHLDNDTAGRAATESIQKALGSQYKVVDKPPIYGKDINDYLCHKIQNQNTKRRSYER